MERQILIAGNGMVLTNGETFGKEIYLADGVSADSYHEITEAEYEILLAMAEEQILGE